MSNITVKQLIESWVHVSPDHKLKVVGSDSESGTAGANMVGDFTGDPNAEGLSVYTDLKNLPTAVASILNHTQNRANFHPASQTPEQVAVAFEDYINEVDKTPFFGLMINEQSKNKFESRNYNTLIDQVVKLYDGVNSNDREAIKNSIADMGKAVFGKSTAEQWKNIFSQSTLDVSDLNNPVLYVYYTTLYMKHEEGKAEVNIQEYTVNKTKYAILDGLIKANAKTLVQLDQKSVDDWLGESSTPERQNAALCFNVEPVEW